MSDNSRTKGTVIVTGGAGFIGSHTVVELSNAGYRPVVVDNFCNSERFIIDRLEEITGRSIRLHEVDCRNGEDMRSVLATEAPVQGLIHFAALKSVSESVERPIAYYENNVGSILTVVDAMVNAKVEQLVFSSSCTVYGQPETLPVTEESPLQPAESPYGRTKQICESLIDDAIRANCPLRAATLRYFNPIGAHPSGLIGELPRGVPDNLVPYITQAAAGLRGQMTVFGNDYETTDGSCVRDYIHVVDLARAHVSALDWLSRDARLPSNEVFNLGTGRGNSVFEAIQAFGNATGRRLDYVVGDRRAGDIPAIYADARKAHDVLGWRADLSLEESMRDAWQWQRNLEKR
ncbi:UDP-glucose 4-epimerase GalE [Lentibacter algarum]|uniref:UDP-glucose 4-epimerase GalE n=1 Tax=Lentibacter algarum TaxID=576131 RepID=UPI003AF8D30A